MDWNTDGLPNGTYIMRLLVDGYKEVEKVILVR
jgi:hypothetical protein